VKGLDGTGLIPISGTEDLKRTNQHEPDRLPISIVSALVIVLVDKAN